MLEGAVVPWGIAEQTLLLQPRLQLRHCTDEWRWSDLSKQDNDPKYEDVQRNSSLRRLSPGDFPMVRCCWSWRGFPKNFPSDKWYYIRFWIINPGDCWPRTLCSVDDLKSNETSVKWVNTRNQQKYIISIQCLPALESPGNPSMHIASPPCQNHWPLILSKPLRRARNHWPLILNKPAAVNTKLASDIVFNDTT